MKKVFILTLLFIVGVTSVVLASEVGERQYSPNEIYKILFAGLDKEDLPQPTTKLKFGENSTAKIDKILQELPFPKGRVARGKVENQNYTQVNYNDFWTIYLSGKGGEQDQKLLAVTFTIKLKNQNVQEKDTAVFLKLKQMYGESTTVSKFIIDGHSFNALSDHYFFDPKLNYYIWEKDNIAITYRCPKHSKDSTLVVEIWDKNYFQQHEINGKYRILSTESSATI